MSRSVFDQVAAWRARLETAPEFHQRPNSLAPEFRATAIFNAIVVDVDNSISVRISVLS